MTKLQGIMKNLPILLKDKGLLIIFATCVTFGVLITFATGKAMLDYTSAQDIQAKIATMEEYLQKFEDKKKKAESEKRRPIAIKELENVQAEILLEVQNHNLKMEGLRSIKDDDKTVSSETKNDAEEVVDGKKNKPRRSISQNKAYELSISGSYEDIMNFLFNFQKRRALVTMRALTISPENEEKYKVKLNYKIYVK